MRSRRKDGDDRTTGTLYVVATPIGNLEDMAPRARSVLAGADLIAAEDTRRTRRLLGGRDGHGALRSLHEHNEASRTAELLDRLEAGADVALVSDAGTPLVADPGFALVRGARRAGIDVVPVPGPCAAIAALSVAGLPTDRFAFEGFLPARGAARARRLGALAREPRTVVLYEAPHRVAAALHDAAARMGSERPALVARELTKRFEQTVRASLGELAAALAQGSIPARGEFVLVIAGAEGSEEDAAAVDVEVDTLLRALLAELPASRASRVASRLTSHSRRTLYQRALALGED